MSSLWTKLGPLGQSVWYDNVARPALASRHLAQIVRDDGVTGGTSNPSIFAAAVEKSDLYDADIAAAGADESPQQIFERAAVADIQAACDLLADVHRASGGRDGYISLEVEAGLAYDRDGTIERAHDLAARVGRPNVMIKVPGTAPGVEAFRALTRAGVSINVTLLFAVERYREVAEAYVDAIDDRVRAGEDVSQIDSVASFFVSRIDNKVDALLPADSPLKGTIAVANAKLAYADVFGQVFAGERWERLQAAGANPQRALWASTSTKNPDYPATMYIDPLIGPHTVTTVPDVTLDAFRAGGTPASTLTSGVDEARAQIAALADHGIDLDQITEDLEREGVVAFGKAYDGMLGAIAAKRGRVAAD